MKLLVLLTVVALSNGAKLDRTYLPPSYAQTSGGSGNFLQTPVSGPADYQRDNGFSQSTPGSSRNGFEQSGNEYAQNGNGFNQNVNDFAQNGNDFEQNGNDFTQNGNDFAQGNAGDYNGFNNFESRPERAQATFERNAAILRQDNQNDGETYAYAYETENGIVAEENGVATNGVEAQGGFSYTGDDGQVYSIRYTADQNGFVPQGDHLPTPPPIPEEIQKALEQNARDEAAGIYDDGTYNQAKYNGDNFDNGNNYETGSTGNNYEAGNTGNNYEAGNTGNNYGAGNNYRGEENYNGDDEDTVVTNNALFRSSKGPAARNQVFTQDNGFNAASQAGANGVEKAYLPPFGQRSGQNGAAQNQVTGFRAQGLNQGPFRNQDGDVNQAYLPPFAAQRTQASAPQANGFRTQRPNQGFGNQASDVSGVEKAYLPPFASQRSSQRNQAALPQNQVDGFRAQGFGNQASGVNGVEKAYIPPFASQKSSQNQAELPQNLVSGFGARVNQGFEGANANGVDKAYLPPFANQRPGQNNQSAPGFRTQEPISNNAGANGVNNAYLPPFGQRSGQTNERNGFARRPSFNARTGYQY